MRGCIAPYHTTAGIYIFYCNTRCCAACVLYVLLCMSKKGVVAFMRCSHPLLTPFEAIDADVEFVLCSGIVKIQNLWHYSILRG